VGADRRVEEIGDGGSVVLGADARKDEERAVGDHVANGDAEAETEGAGAVEAGEDVEKGVVGAFGELDTLGVVEGFHGVSEIGAEGDEGAFDSGAGLCIGEVHGGASESGLEFEGVDAARIGEAARDGD